MSSTRAFWEKTPNARLVYQQLDPGPDTASALANSVNALSELERIVMEETRYQWANPDVFLYFFFCPSEEAFDKAPFWVAREVVGPPNEDPLERFFLHDLQAGWVFQRDVGGELFQLGDVEQLRELYHATHKDMQEQRPVNTAPTWRLRLENGGISSRAQIQLFPE